MVTSLPFFVLATATRGCFDELAGCHNEALPSMATLDWDCC